ncbi:MAG: hypothetical protein WC926_00820 [Candidatus Paceibacterota bacterium]
MRIYKTMDPSWYAITLDTLVNLWEGFIIFIPKLIVALIIFAIGWLVSIGAGRLVAEILSRLGFDKLLGKNGWQKAMAESDISANASEFIGAIVKWTLAVTFLSASIKILDLTQFDAFLDKVVIWLPNLVVATAIFVVSVVLADVVEKIIRVWVKRMGISYSDLIGTIARGAIYILAALAILDQLGVASTLVNTLIIGLVATLSLALGLAFGLGGRDAAAKAIEDIKERLSGK